MSEFAQNVGPWDAAARFVAGIALLVGAFWSIRRFDVDWTLTILVHPAILAVYLLLTAAARNDIAYHVFGWSTARPRARRSRVKLAPPLAPGRRGAT